MSYYSTLIYPHLIICYNNLNYSCFRCDIILNHQLSGCVC